VRLLFSLVLLFPLALGAQSFRVVKLVEGLDHPWSLAFLPDGRMLLTERPGRLELVGRDFKRTRIEGLPRVYASGQGGLLEVALHPRFAENRFIYLSYAGPGDGGASTELARAKLVGERLVDLRVLFVEEPKTTGGLHFGGRIVFDRAGFLYLTLGERGQMQRAQVRRQAGLAAGEVRPWPSQHAGRGAAPAHARALDARARPAGRRRDQHHSPRHELRLAGHHLRRQLRHRHEDRRGHPQGRHGAAAVLLGAVDRSLGHGVLHRRSVPGLER
jgi:glucose/sorbosone dehydrogenase